MKPLARIAAIALALTCGGCDRPVSTDSPLQVSAIGARAVAGDPNLGPLDPARREIMDATAQGLVRFDAAGQIEPGLAASWKIDDEGRSFIFRLREAQWADGTPVTTEDVVRYLRRAYAPGSRNPLAPFLAVIDEIVAMTDTVIEVRLKRPRPDLLKLFAQPELAIFRPDTMDGSGPYRAKPDPGSRAALLIPATDPADAGEEDHQEPTPGSYIRLRGERAALALAHYKQGRADLVLGGSFADWPVLQVADVRAGDIRIDPAIGMFGLAIVSRDGFLADPANRAAIAMSIDRGAVTQAFKPDWAPVETILPAQLDSAAPPAAAAWAPLALDARRTNASERVRIWRRANPGVLRIRVALPSAPGSSLVWNAIGRSLLAIGVLPVRVGFRDDADLRLIDMVAPYDSGRWFLVTACRLCSEDAATLIEAARDAPTLDARAHRIAEADAALTDDVSYIPIAQPLRWSIVTNRVTEWQGNTRAWHPLNHLRNEGE